MAVATGFVTSCRVDNSEKLHDPILMEGQQLAQKHCGNCHQVPTPDLLDKQTWIEHVLPAMAPNLGLETYPGGQYYAGSGAAISFNDWQKLVAYYQALAPIKLKPAKVPVDPEEDLANFSLQKPQTDTSQTAITTLVAMDTAGRQLFSSDGIRSDLTRWNQQLQPEKFRQLPSAAVNAQFIRDAKGNRQGVFTSMGTMRAEDGLKGEVISLNLSSNQKPDSLTIDTALPRPIQSVHVDINKDGLTDWVVCGFGHSKGGLYWLKQEKNGKFSRQSIKDVAGPIQSTVGDFNADGWPDLMVLFAHADEGVWLFLNDKKGGFTERNVLRFPAVYGSTSFQLVDFNKDGRQDILYTCGDNSDYSPVLKPYHGVYIYLNQGDFRYKQAYFYPINGCTKAVATDFDKDGDLDIMTIAFFADFQDNPAESCLYFEQQKTLEFLPHALPISTYGRWICMDVNDFDQDGDADVVLGNFSKTFIIQKDLKPTWDTHLPLILLKNKTR
ncbi:FG-GAP repeat domain-containing protein [Spirosoma flavus]